MEELLAEAIAHHQAFEFDTAETLYRRCLEQQPANPAVMNLLGTLLADDPSMNVRLTLRIQGGLLVFLAGTLLVPIPFSFWFGDRAWPWFLLTATLAAGAGQGLLRLFPERKELTIREGFGVVTFAWILFAAFGEEELAPVRQHVGNTFRFHVVNLKGAEVYLDSR
mgnify:CR=1 FL=1